jgi:hypothetical protein
LQNSDCWNKLETSILAAIFVSKQARHFQFGCYRYWWVKCVILPFTKSVSETMELLRQFWENFSATCLP